MLGREGLLSHYGGRLEFHCRHLTSGQCSDLPQVRPPRIWGCFSESGQAHPPLALSALNFPSWILQRRLVNPSWEPLQGQ